MDRFHDQRNPWVSSLLESTTEVVEHREAVFSNEFYMVLKTKRNNLPFVSVCSIKKIQNQDSDL